MHNSSSNAQAALGRLLTLTPTASSPAPQKSNTTAQRQSENQVSFSDTLSGARQEVARERLDTRRPAHARPDQDSRSHRLSSSERAASSHAERARATEQQARAPAHPRPADRDHTTTHQTTGAEKQAVEASKNDETSAPTTSAGDEVEGVASDASSVVPEVVQTGLESEPGVAAGNSSEMMTDGLVAEVTEDSDASLVDRNSEQPLVGESGLENIVQEPETIVTGASPIPGALPAEESAVVGVTLGTSTASSTAFSSPTTSSPTTKTALGSESLLAKSAVVAVTDSGGNPGAAMSGEQGEATGQNTAGQSFAKLLASSEANVMSRESTASQATPAIEAIARAVESLAPAGRGFVVQSGVAPTVGNPQWSQAVGDRVLWLAAQNITSAELRLDPPELGPMRVRVSVHHDQVQVTFTSPHTGVREALDQGAARLREMFNEQGLNLNVEVSDQSLSRRGDEEGSSKGRGNGGDEHSSEEAVVAEVAINKLRLIDHYA